MWERPEHPEVVDTDAVILSVELAGLVIPVTMFKLIADELKQHSFICYYFSN